MASSSRDQREPPVTPTTASGSFSAPGRLLDRPRRARTASPRRTGGRSAAGRAAGPRAESPAGATSPGSPAMLTVTVKTSLRYISTGSAEPFSPMPKAADGVAGVRIASTPSAKARLEVALDQRADLLRPHVIGVVVAGGEHIGADHQPPPHLRAEALRRGSSRRGRRCRTPARAGRSARRRSARDCSRPPPARRCNRRAAHGACWAG